MRERYVGIFHFFFVVFHLSLLLRWANYEQLKIGLDDFNENICEVSFSFLVRLSGVVVRCVGGRDVNFFRITYK